MANEPTRSDLYSNTGHFPKFLMLTLNQAFRRCFNEVQGDGGYTGFEFLSSRSRAIPASSVSS